MKMDVHMDGFGSDKELGLLISHHFSRVELLELKQIRENHRVLDVIPTTVFSMLPGPNSLRF